MSVRRGRNARKESNEGGNGAAEGAGIHGHACSLTNGRHLHGWPG